MRELVQFQTVLLIYESFERSGDFLKICDMHEILFVSITKE